VRSDARDLVGITRVGDQKLLDFGAGLEPGAARSEARQDLHAVAALRLSRSQRDPHVAHASVDRSSIIVQSGQVAHEAEVSREHTDHLVAVTVQHNGATEYSIVAAESARPEVMTQKRHARAVLGLGKGLVRDERPSDLGAHTQQLKQACTR
jgi:hypothetical protein